MEMATKPPDSTPDMNIAPTNLDSSDMFSSYKAVKPKMPNDFKSTNFQENNNQDLTLDFELSFNERDPFSISFSPDDPFKDVDTSSFTDNNWCSFDDTTPDNPDLKFDIFPDRSSYKEESKNNSEFDTPKPRLGLNGLPNEDTDKRLPEFKIGKAKATGIVPLPDIQERNSQECIRELRLHNSILSHRSGSLQAENKALENKVGLLEKELYQSKHKNATITGELAKLKKQEEDANKSLKENEKYISDLQKKFSSFEKQNMEKFSNMKREYDFLRESLRTAEEYMIQIENSTDKQLMNEANDLLELRNAEIDTLHDSLNKRDEVIENLAKSVKHLETENMILNGQLNNNFDYNFLIKQWEEDLQEKLDMQRAALSADAKAKYLAQEQEIEKLNFDLERQERKMAAIHEKLVSKTDENILLQTEVEFLSNIKDMLTDQIEEKAKENELNIQQFETEYDGKEKETKSISIQNSKLEALVTAKDTEIIQFKRQVHDYEEQILKLTRDLNSTKFELNLKEAQVIDAENNLEAKENDSKLQHLVAIEDTENELRKQSEEFEKVNREHIEIIKRSQKTIELLVAERDNENKRYMESIEIIEKKDQKLKEMKEIILELETKLSSADGGVEMATLKQAYKELLTMVSKTDSGASIESPLNNLTQIPQTHNPPSNNSIIQFQPKSTPTITSDLFGSRYTAVKGDLIDEAVEKFIRSQAKIALPSVKRVEHGIYLIAGTKQLLSLTDNALYVKVGNDYISLAQFFLDYKSSIFNKNMNIQRPSFDPIYSRYN